MTAPSPATRGAAARLVLAWQDGDRQAVDLLATEAHDPLGIVTALLDLAAEYVPADDLRQRLLRHAAHDTTT